MLGINRRELLKTAALSGLGVLFKLGVPFDEAMAIYQSSTFGKQPALDAGGASCSGNYGAETQSDNYNAYLDMAIVPVVLDCDASSGTIYVWTQYATGKSVKPIIYDSNGDQVWVSSGGAGTADWYSEAFSGLSLTTGTYYIGAAISATGARWGRYNSAGTNTLGYSVTYASLPTSVVLGSPDWSWTDIKLQAYLAF